MPKRLPCSPLASPRWKKKLPRKLLRNLQRKNLLQKSPQWKNLPQAGPKALLYMVLGGGVVAGAVGMLCFYTALKGAPLTRVMPIAFTSPLFGALMGAIFAGEPLTLKTVAGMLLTVGGIVLLSL